MGQKLSCTFKLDVEGLGYLEGGAENDVSVVAAVNWSWVEETPRPVDPGRRMLDARCQMFNSGCWTVDKLIYRFTSMPKSNYPCGSPRRSVLSEPPSPSPVPLLPTLPALLFHSSPVNVMHLSSKLPYYTHTDITLFSEFTTVPLPPPYSNRVKAALNASGPSVKLGNLVGGAGFWYLWGRRIASV
jgi:hypothetical protein